MKYNQESVINGICSATLEVFSTMLSAEVSAEQPYTETSSSGASDGVIAMVGLAGDWVGGGMLQCDAKLARKIHAQLLMVDPTDEDGVNEDILDAVAEVANMIIGNLKNALEPELGPVGMSVPTVIFGRNFMARNAGISSWLVVPFAFEDDKFYVKFFLAPSAKRHPVKHGFNLRSMVSL